MKIKVKDLKRIIKEVALGDQSPGSAEELIYTAGDDAHSARAAWESGDFAGAANAYEQAAQKLKQAAEITRAAGDQDYANDLEDEVVELLSVASDALERAGGIE